MKSPEVVYQEDIADCGLACLAMIARSFGREYDLAMLKSNFKSSAEGTSLAELLAAAQKLGFTTRAVRCEPKGLKSLRFPVLLHWGFNHYVILWQVTKQEYIILDPAVGKRNLSASAFSQFFTGIAVEFSSLNDLKQLDRVDRLTIFNLLSSARNAPIRLGYCLLLSTATIIGALVLPLFVRAVLEFAVYPANLPSLYILIILAFISSAFFALIGYVKYLAINSLSRDVERALSSFLNKLIFSTSFSFFMQKTPGMIARYYQNLRRVRQIISDGIIEVFIDIITIFIIVLLTILLNLPLGLSLLFVISTYFVIFIFNQRGRVDHFRKTAAIDSFENLILMDNLRNVQAIKLNGLEDVRSSIWHTAYRRAADALDALNGMSTRSDFAGNAWLGLSRCLLVAVAGFEVVNGNASLETFFSFSIYQAFLTLSLANLSRRLTGLADVQTILTDMSTLLVAERDPMLVEQNLSESDVNEFSIQGHAPDRPASSLVLTCSYLSYRFDTDTRRIFRDLSFDVKAGEIIAVTGKSGSGKSTLLRLITGLLTHDEGEILWYGTSIKTWSRPKLAQYVATVMQEDQIFGGTVLQNISHFTMNPDMDRVHRVCDMACVSPFLPRLKMGLHSRISSNSTLLSVGEKQRLFLARALYLPANTLLLDEFTGNLDQEIEEVIFRNLRSLEKTVIMTAHRESTIRQADRVLHLDVNERRLIELHDLSVV
ncbi:cysteine peptidase family C39 domain-containing protein [Agrobacterium sp. SHOUNA12C]|jgi:ATP-binding cassette subfamily B protein RaxB|uniref:peptidase domain-containing ABC transporter n=1 Tax=Rhizobium rhizogenes TaxID=359 RepID=UPI001572BC72|nr:cysteine peptidase family C39 domain-containing protein [Rhizobium rhizogenes]MCJ9720028.1 cysteine peptidase family C39 domain-containing protein [Agrobacterium sp. BETTINA12B]MCJ9755037.1 cysteine peptidase family C39 domain-containing protein [Agrobacterium sp. SHOUNA12C]NTF53065.1 ATP-binding cassette domain-containing protein [Rhizobium rhizogenes]NTG18771.1 ATP-binding cassette domain-containing protein [Rhizobium rhizogenes]NTH03618.1 ATP-binding cassette domain-containing protein [R